MEVKESSFVEVEEYSSGGSVKCSQKLRDVVFVDVDRCMSSLIVSW